MLVLPWWLTVPNSGILYVSFIHLIFMDPCIVVQLIINNQQDAAW